MAGSWLGSPRRVIDVVRQFGHWIVPGVFMLIGAVIVIESGVLGRLLGGVTRTSRFVVTGVGRSGSRRRRHGQHGARCFCVEAERVGDDRDRRPHDQLPERGDTGVDDCTAGNVLPSTLTGLSPGPARHRLPQVAA